MRSTLAAVALALMLCPALAAAQAPRQSQVRIMDRIAQNHFEAGNEYFQVARYDDAAREFQRAFEISHQNELQFNIGRALEAAGDIRGALEAYQRFDQAGAPGFDRDVLHARMENLRGRLGSSASPAPAGNPASASPSSNTASPSPASQSPAPSSATASASGSPAPRHTHVESSVSPLHQVGPIAAIGIGLVLGGFAAWQAATYSSDQSAVSQVNAGTQPWSSSASAAYSGAGSAGTVAWVLGGVGAVFLVGGAVWLIARPHQNREVVDAFLIPTPTGAVFGIGGRL